MKAHKLYFIEEKKNKLLERKKDSENLRILSFVLGEGGGGSNSP